ncbi:hypothetical protein Tco_0677963 [Tanacetum coccineum]|uniref:Uncharacterized protein n=1 Tax=Tanacetum coccineum TaxID=301880 RepID=A0ABQ4XDS7_9ASTR
MILEFGRYGYKLADQIAMTVLKIKKFYKKTGRSQEWMEKCMWHLIREKLNVSIATILGILQGSASLKVQRKVAGRKQVEVRITPSEI